MIRTCSEGSAYPVLTNSGFNWQVGHVDKLLKECSAKDMQKE